MAKKNQGNWINVLDDGQPQIDWEQAVRNAMAFDQGERDINASMGKIITSVQRMAFEQGFEAGVNSKHPQGYLLSTTMGNA